MTLSARSQTRLNEEIERLRLEGQVFAVATVVRTVDATSAKPGAKALVLADGTLAQGWVGGSCARAAVAKAALEAMRAGAPQFVSLRPEELLDAEGVHPGEERAGVRFARNGCPSKGSMDIFVEPVLPLPRLVICGDGPVALALADLAGRFDFFRMLCAPGQMAAPLPEVEALRDSFAFDTAPGVQRFVVVATQGKGDAAALRAAIASGAEYIAFVGSRRKFAALAEKLRADGVEAEALARVQAPAGLHIHAITPDEIALSILAQIVAARRTGKRA
ncbi:XdhC family protein [Pararhodobacter sp.]|jgi:xanthine dehydrogenase accessory factor|uniref:XdhC family protein n=1 Tax=Pararhodobacter sp. TaxID=2127056 RepID=UPI002FDD769F